MEKESYGARLKRLRLQRGLTQLELAKLIGKDYRGPNTVSLWESDRGHPKWGDLENVANALGCTIDYIITGKPGRKPRDIMRPPGKPTSYQRSVIDAQQATANT